MKAPERIETPRLILRKPTPGDAESIFARYASDPEVTRLLSWPTHQSIDDTRVFLAFSESEWQRWPAGPFLIESRSSHQLLGSTGFAFESPTEAATGYVLAKDAWGRGYATEALSAIVSLSPLLGLRRLYALCHPEHSASAHVLEKCGFQCETLVHHPAAFPNLASDQHHRCLLFSRSFG